MTQAVLVEMGLFGILLFGVLVSFHIRHKQTVGYCQVRNIYILGLLSAIIDTSSVFYGNLEICTIVAELVRFVLLGAMGYFWITFLWKQYGKSFSCSQKILLWIPSILACVCALFCVTGSKMLQIGTIRSFLWLNGIYVLAPIVYTLFFPDAQTKRQKREAQVITCSALPVLILCGLQALFLPDGASVLCFSVGISLLILTLHTQYRKILIDNLTRLPNRYGMEEEIEEQLAQYRRDKNDSFYVIACDMDNFKTINDTWGHQEGDRALKLIGDALTKVAEEYNAEAFRIGGDEFVIITDTAEKGLANSVCNRLREELDAISFRDDFDICMSMGIAFYDGKISIAELLNSADKELYQVKRTVHS